jgi:hypothetical protein
MRAPPKNSQIHFVFQTRSRPKKNPRPYRNAVAVLGALAAAPPSLATPTATEHQPPSRRADLPKVSVSGNAFWAGDERFYIRGIDYQPGGASARTDPLSDPDVCKRDIAEFAKLGINSVRVYMVDNTASHDECMAALAAEGIYLLLDLNNPGYSINRADPHPSYNAAYLQSIFATVDAFVDYSNTLLFFSGNEVINDEANTTKTAPYVKAVTRDVKNYMKKRGYRHVPVGYSAADVSSNRMQTAQYMNCGADDVRSDFFAFNDYSWCNSDFKTAGWDQKVKNFTDYGLPIFLSEYGCIENGRDFGEIGALMSDDMTGVYSGGLMYEYSMEANNFGIVEIGSDDKVDELDGFAKFASAMSKYPAPTGSAGAAKTTHSVACPTSDAVWEVDPTAVPLMPTQAQKYMDDGAGPGPGLKGGSQTNEDSGVSPSDGDSEKSTSGSNGGGDDSGVGRVGTGGVWASAAAAVVAVAVAVSL